MTKKYTITRDVEHCEGTQEWTVFATSEGEAIEKYKKGECELTSSEVEVMRLSEHMEITEDE